MNLPNGLHTLLDNGVIDDVVDLVKDGKNAAIYAVRCGVQVQCAKVYCGGAHLDADHAGRARGSERGNSEAAALIRLAAAGVRVPRVFWHSDAVLLMEYIIDAAGHPAPDLDAAELLPDDALALHRVLMSQTARMLCADVLHGDWSAQNVLVGTEGPVIIDFARVLSVRGNANAKKLLHWNVTNITVTLARWEPTLMASRFADEIWALFQLGQLRPDTLLTGDFIRVGDPGTGHLTAIEH